MSDANLERIDDLQIGGCVLIQNKEGFRFGTDAVLLSSFAKAKRGETVLDLGTGTGIIPILMSVKTAGMHFTGLELLPEMAEMAERSVRLNNLQDRIDIVAGDIKKAPEIFKRKRFNVITANPPYMKANSGVMGEASSVAVARHEIMCTLEDVARTAVLLSTGGRFYMVHRPHRLVDIFCAFRQYKLEPKTLRLVLSRAEEKPVLALIEAVRDGKPQLTVEAPLVLYGCDGKYTDEANKIYYG